MFCSLKEVGLTVNLSKCEFGQDTVTYLGEAVGGGQVECIMAFPVPTTCTELRRYLAMDSIKISLL